MAMTDEERKAKRRAYEQTPEVKANRRAYEKTPERVAKAREHQRTFRVINAVFVPQSLVEQS